jgi:hypothetical protein
MTGMILVLAGIVDQAAELFATELASSVEVSLVTCTDLASAPLNLLHPNFAASTITVRGETLSVDRVAGVVNLLPAVFPYELIFYDEAERDYQASEFHALLTFFLSSLTCPVINRATATSLSGPFLNPFGWRRLARSLGIAVADIEVRSDAFVNPLVVTAGRESIEVVCLGDRVISPSDTVADAHTRSLARHAGVEYLRALFVRDANGGLEYLTAHTTPDVTSAATRAAIADYFTARHR